MAALVAADSLARSGQRVKLAVPEGPLCGGFASYEVDGRTLSMGLRLLELDYGTASSAPGLDEYRPGPTGHAPFISLIRDWFEELMEGQLFEASRPRLAFDGRVHEDIHITADLSPLREIVGESRADRIATEAREALRLVGPSGILSSTVDPWSIDLESASRTNHGLTFHELLIEPICRKITGASSAEIVTALRRKAWIPIYHPETVAQAADHTEMSYRPYRPFHVDAAGGCGLVVGRLIQRVETNPRIDVVTVGRLISLAQGDGGKTAIAFNCGTNFDAMRPIIGVGADELFGAAGIDYRTPRLNLHLIWVELDELDLADLRSTVLIADSDLGVTRISGGGVTMPGKRLLVAEMAHDHSGSSARVIEDALIRSGILSRESPFSIVHELQAPLLPAPNAGAVAAHRGALDDLACMNLQFQVVGGAIAPGADSLNEQILQGLAAASDSRVALNV